MPRLLIERETDFQRDLPMVYLAILDMSAGLAHFEPAHVTNRFFGARDGIFDRVLDSIRRGTDQLDFFVNVIAHAFILQLTHLEHN